MRADHDLVKKQLNIAKGQLESVSRMVDSDAYCIDISNQLLATISLLKKINQTIISAHLKGCVKDARSEEELDKKLTEIEYLLKRSLS